MDNQDTVTLPREQLQSLLAQLQAFAEPAPTPEPEPIEYPPVTLTGAQFNAMNDHAAELARELDAVREERDAINAMAAKDAAGFKRSLDNYSLEAKRNTEIVELLREQIDSMKPKVHRFALPLFLVALFAIVHTYIVDRTGFADMMSAVKYLTVGAALGLAVDIVTHLRHQPEGLEGIAQNGAWMRRMWLMAFFAICLCVRP